MTRDYEQAKMTDQKNTILAIVLSALVLIGWQIFFGVPQIAEAEAAAEAAAQTQQQAEPARASSSPRRPGTARRRHPRSPTAARQTHDARSRRSRSRRACKIDTPLLAGSIALKGGRIDDLSLTKYRETVDPKSPPIVLLAPSGQPASVLCRIRLVAACAARTIKLPAPTRCGSSRAPARSASTAR